MAKASLEKILLPRNPSGVCGLMMTSELVRADLRQTAAVQTRRGMALLRVSLCERRFKWFQYRLYKFILSHRNHIRFNKSTSEIEAQENNCLYLLRSLCLKTEALSQASSHLGPPKSLR